MMTETAIRDGRILIVDDQPSNVQLLERMLADNGYGHVQSTMNPREVCALHSQHDYDAILLDLKMPGMDGFEVMRDLTLLCEGDYLPVIVLTAEPGHRLAALKAGAKDFISKPFDLLEVQTRIRNMLEVRLLYRRVARHNLELEATLAERTTQLRESESRFRRLTALASDWYWEQNEHGSVTHVSGPVAEMLGFRLTAVPGGADDEQQFVWDDAERKTLWNKIADREPFVDFPFSRLNNDGSTQRFRVSGEPVFDHSCRYIGYRGIGTEILSGA